MFHIDSKGTNIKAIVTDRALNADFSGSKIPYNKLNVAYHVGDNAENVRKNRAFVIEKYFLDSNNTNFSSKILVYLNQIHSNHIVCIKQNEIRFYTPEFSKNIESLLDFTQQNLASQNLRELNLGNADGIICDDPRFIALVMVADCNAILLFARGVFGLVHAGREGLRQEILSNALHILKDEFRLKPSEINVYISPSIRACCYEIGDMAKEFSGKYLHGSHLDMIAMACDELHKNGVKNIDISNTCTNCNKNYFSYRRNKTTGRFGIFANMQN